MLHSTNGAFDPASAPPGLAGLEQRVCATGKVATVSSPWGSARCTSGAAVAQPARAGGTASTLLSADRSVALVTIGLVPGAGDRTGVTVQEAVRPLASPQLQVEVTGDAFAAVNEGGGVPPEVIGFIAALLILAVVFRAVFATVLPLVSAAAALGSGLGLVSLLTHVMSVASFASQLTILMVLGVGVDYALFIVTRHRRNLLAGMTIEDSIVSALNTSGRAVFFAGWIVCIAILGLWALGVSFLYGVSVATAVGVLLTMVASLTLMPALLSFIGLRVLPRRVRRSLVDGTYRPSTRRSAWARWSDLVARRRIVLALVAGAVLVVLAVPFFSMRLGHADQGNDPASTTTRRGYDLISDHFGRGANSVLEVVATGPRASDPVYLQSVAQRLATVADVDRSTIRAVPAGNGVGFVTFKSTSAPQDVATTDLVKTLRSDVLPGLYRGSDNHLYVFGQTAVYVDFAKVLSAKMPLFFAAVVGLSFLLLVVAFRSLLIPATAAVMNLLAAGASFGIVVMVFQWGWGASALGIGTGGPIEAFAPVMFFAILFGLSMDYQVFLISRMHEEWVHSHDNRRAITVGQAETGGIITVAALIMVAVFGGFVLGDERVIKLFGIGLASAIFLDAFVVRTVLVPSLMHLFGRSNWYYPEWLARVTPRLSLEPEEQPPTEPERELATTG